MSKLGSLLSSVDSLATRAAAAANSVAQVARNDVAGIANLVDGFVHGTPIARQSPDVPAPQDVAPLAPVSPEHLQQLSNALDAATGTTATQGNQLQTSIDGEHALPAILAGIDSAQKSVTYESYQFVGGDPVTNEVADHLIAAHNRGVDVRLVVDAFGSRVLPLHDNATVNRLRAAGIPVQVYDPLDGPDDLAFHRDHRKTIVIDGQKAFVGGMNTGSEYMGTPDVPKRFHDLMMQIQGPAVSQIAVGFADSWKAAGGGDLPAFETPPAAAPIAGGLPTRIIEHVPGGPENIDGGYLALINNAQSRINVENSYPMRSDLVDALCAAAKRGVDVRYIVGSNEGLLGDAARANYQKLLDAGVHIYAYPDRIHTKSISVDGAVCSVGSCNVDDVALSRNREVVAMVEDPAFTQQYDANLFDRDVLGDPQGRKTVELPRKLDDSLWQKILDGTLNDLWP